MQSAISTAAVASLSRFVGILAQYPRRAWLHLSGLDNRQSVHSLENQTAHQHTQNCSSQTCNVRTDDYPTTIISPS
jgi:hypothetical protein